MNKLTHEELTGKIIACAIAVHKALGPGFLESVYEAAMLIELRHAGLRVESQKTVRVYYRGAVVGEHRMDLLVEDLIMTELKAISGLEKIHFSIARSCLKAAGLEHGLIFNFATMPLTVKRVIYCPGQNDSSDFE
jgi:GxxExxY protein